jgi:hypothetical protein
MHDMSSLGDERIRQEENEHVVIVASLLLSRPSIVTAHVLIVVGVALYKVPRMWCRSGIGRGRGRTRLRRGRHGRDRTPGPRHHRGGEPTPLVAGVVVNQFLERRSGID